MEYDDFSGAQAFSDQEALRALEGITRRRPQVIALERTFAATTRGAALINRIKADPKLSACEIRIVAQESGYARVAPTTDEAPAGEGAAVAIAGNVATLIDLSIIGAQVVSQTILKPNQRVRMSIGDTSRPVRFGAAVAWASFELAKTGPRYRAGIEFFDADADALRRFCEAKKQA